MAAERRACGSGVLIVQVLFANPIFEPADVGGLPIANGLLLAYAVPAAWLSRRGVGPTSSATRS
jgi:uncharacterized membrane protein